MSEHPERGMQVVRVEKSGSYQLDEGALKEVLLHEDVADCRVALVSVAGAFRGGKSFLLDFMLRYLHAEEAERTNGSWLGADHEALVGFNWRGGSERDTTGLLLWSRPLRVKLPSSGEPIAVLLMDTQGAFDSRSSVRDCSTIFALSTLLSSVQIYNLKENIKEDNLQHLQLFTEYGKMALASNDGSKPFQSLNFLIRDWSYGFEHPYGAEGGKQLLAKRLKIDEDQAQELQELRQHITECFDTVDCFLMPHPGFTVFDQQFMGCLSDIEEGFKKSLLEFVPSILGNLRPKLINGENVNGRDLFHYFRSYVEIFNSNELPEPLTIMRATADASLLSAMESSRKFFREAMETACDRSQPSMPVAMLRARHAVARDAAIRAFDNRRHFGNRQAFHSARLLQELDDTLERYVLINEAKYQTVIAVAKKRYEEKIQSINSIERLCLHPIDLQEVQRSALEDAVAFFDSKRLNEGAEDVEKTEFVQDLTARFEHIRIFNEMNNKAAVVVAREAYTSFMVTECGEQPCINIKAMELKHDEGNARAMVLFESRRDRPSEHPVDTHKEHLSEHITERYGRIQSLNEINNLSAVRAAISYYNAQIGPICADHLPCLHPSALREEHQEARQMAVTEFFLRRNEDSNTEDEYVTQIDEELSRRYQVLEEINERNNNSAVNTGLVTYSRAMDETVRPNRLQLTPDALAEVHRLSADLALQSFRMNRRHQELREQDHHRDSLTQIMDDRFMYYREVNERNPLNVNNILLVLAGIGALVAGAMGTALTGGIAPVAAGGAAMAAAAAGTTNARRAARLLALAQEALVRDGLLQFARRFF